jgi:hypothetical protein
MDLAPGTMLGACRIEAPIGQGGMGVVYRARDLDLDRDVAVKVIAPHLLDDPETQARFLREARAASAVEHPNIVPVHAVGVAEGRAFLVMRHVAGDDLRTAVLREGALDPADAAQVTTELGDALDAIHAAGYVHRDVKPRNVLLDPGGRVYLSDFGLARETLGSSGPTASRQWVGTLHFVAPEQIRGEAVDARADVYALGGVLFFMLTGRLPFPRPSDEATLWAHLHTPPPAPSAARPGLPPGLDAVVQRAMAKDRDARWPSAGALGRAALAAAGPPGSAATTRVAGPPGSAATTRVADLTAATRRRRRPGRRLAPAALIATGAAALLAWAVAERGDSDAPRDRPPGRAPPGASASSREHPRIAETYPRVAARPRAAVVAAGAVWVLSAHENRIARLDARTGRRLRRQPFIGRGAAGIAADAGTVWVAKRATTAVLELDARTATLRRRVPMPLPPVRVAADATGLWVVARTASDAPAVVLRYDRAGTRLLEQAWFDEGVSAIAVGGGAAWVALAGTARIMRLAPGRRPTLATWLNEPASVLSYGAGQLWASIPDDDSIAGFHPRRDRLVTTAVRQRPAGLAVARGRLFVASNTQHTLEVLDPRALRRGALKHLRMPLNPYAVTSGGGSVWVTGLANGSVTRVVP